LLALRPALVVLLLLLVLCQRLVRLRPVRLLVEPSFIRAACCFTWRIGTTADGCCCCWCCGRCWWCCC
jgi:hypothetical protein